MKIKAIALSIISVVGIVASNHASATTNMFDPSVSTTGVADGSSIRLDATLNDVFGQAEPWTMQVYAEVGQCLRLFVPTTSFDSELTVIAPNGSVFRDDDGGGSNRPLVKIASAPNKGWYTVHVAHYAGAAITANFGLLYGRYAAGNVNCAGGTIPVSAFSTPENVKDESDVGPVIAPRANSPGAE